MKDIKVTLIDRNGNKHILKAPTDMNMNLMELCKSYDFPVQGICGGMAMCASCQIYIHSKIPIANPSEDELAMLSEALKFNLFTSSKSSINVIVPPKEVSNCPIVPSTSG